MLQRFVHLSILYFVCALIVGGLSATLGNNNAVRHTGSSEVTRESFFTNTVKTRRNFTINDTRAIQIRFSNSSKFENSKKINPQTSRTKVETIAKSASILQTKNTQKSGGKKSNNLFADSLKVPAVNKKDQVIREEEVRKLKVSGTSKIRDKATRTDANKKRRKLIDVVKEQRAKIKRSKKMRILQDPTAEKKIPVEEGYQARYLALDVTGTKSSLNETSLSLRSLFRVPKLRKPTDCSNRKGGMQRNVGSGQSSAAHFRFSDRGHTELINQFEKEQSLDELAGEYVHPEGHISPTIDYRKTDVVHSVFGLHEPKLQSGSIVSSSKYLSNSDLPANPFSNENDKNERMSVLEVDDTVDSIIDNEADTEMHYNDDGVNLDYYLSLKHKRDVEAILDDQAKSSRAQKTEDIHRQHVAMDEKLILNGVSVETAENSWDETKQASEKQIQNTTSQILLDLHNFDDIRTTDTPWPLVPGPISCDLDFQLQPSFVAKLGEFDYVVSVQLQRNPDEPADHACTGVVYNPRFIVIAPHCLHDNYGLTVTSTDDLCTIDEMIEVDYIIEHENYDAETRRNDIALIKLKSEIHKRAATFPKDDGALGKTFYAVGFGELMWRQFPDKISKLLQKVPVRRYPRVLKEAPGTLHITTSHMDLTGAFRGDFGGALINPQGELVGLKSKLVKKSTEYEVYTRVRTYLPWIQSMVALHGLW